jgi:hypothetical protein
MYAVYGVKIEYINQEEFGRYGHHPTRLLAPELVCFFEKPISAATFIKKETKQAPWRPEINDSFRRRGLLGGYEDAYVSNERHDPKLFKDIPVWESWWG